MKKQKIFQRGFTLIELLVVISIIGLLSTLAVVSLNNARAKSRDAKRLADVKQIMTALEMFYNDCNSYPPRNTTNASLSTGDGWTVGDGNCGKTMASYMTTIPAAPTPVDGSVCSTANASYYYTSYESNGTDACGTAPCPTYKIQYCIGSTVGGIPGNTARTATPAGM
jgi:prepilin-type N-terminal cleavage/methylation domain-containing protein